MIIVRKGREREFIGRLQSFDDLPIKNQEVLKEIKGFLNEFFNKEVEAYVYGSYFHGFSDEYSDYDILINENFNRNEIDGLIYKKLNHKANIIFSEDKLSNILIP
jgi:predicted nucleotidyltransferase